MLKINRGRSLIWTIFFFLPAVRGIFSFVFTDYAVCAHWLFLSTPVLQTPCSQRRVAKINSSDRNFALHIGLDARLKDSRLNPLRPNFRVNLTGNVAVHQHVGMTFWHIFLPSSSTMRIGGMLHAKLPPAGSPLQNSMYNSAAPTLVCKGLSPRIP